MPGPPKKPNTAAEAAIKAEPTMKSRAAEDEALNAEQADEARRQAFMNALAAEHEVAQVLGEEEEGGTGPTQIDLAKDWTDVADPPDFSPDYVYEWQKTTDGADYRKRLVPYSAPAVEIATGPAPDGMQLDSSVRNSGRWQEFDFCWNSDRNEAFSQEAHRTGFVKVDPEQWNDTTRTYRKEAGKVINGDLYLMARPKAVTMQRAIEHKRLSDRLMGKQLDTTAEQMDNISGGRSDYGRVEEFRNNISNSDHESYDENTARSLHHAEQIQMGQNAARGRTQFAVNAPYQKTIIGGRVITDPGIVAAVGGGS